MRKRPRVIIVGGGFAGLAAARALRRTEAEVVLFDRRNHHLFQPLLYQVATAALSPGNIAAPIRRILARQRNCEVLMAEVDGADLEARHVTAAGRRYDYDYLVVGAGVRTNYFGHDAWAARAPGLKTVEEALDVRARFLLAFERAELEGDAAAREAALTFVIVGAGPTGVELAGAFAEISRHTLRRDFRHFDTTSARVKLIDMADRVLPTFDPRISSRALRDLKRLGIETMLETRVEHVDARGLTLRQGGQRQRLDADNIIWAAGVKAVELSASLGAETDAAGRVKVGEDLTVPGHAEVFVVGDLAHCVDPATGSAVPGVAPAAIQMGRFTGRTIAAEIRARRRGRAPRPRGRFVYRDKGALATIGRRRAVAQIGRLRLGGFPAFVVWALVHIYFLIDFRQRLLTLAEWTWLYFFYERGVRLITGRRPAPGPPAPATAPRPPACREPDDDRGGAERSGAL